MTLFESAYVGTEEWHVSRSQFVAKIDVAMGGRAAEEIVFGKDKVERHSSNGNKSFLSRPVIDIQSLS